MNSNANKADDLVSNDVPPGALVIFSGPSGAGKTTVLKQVIANCHRPLVISVSATTRPMRDGEIDGVSYHFLSPEQFQQKRQQDEFLECEEVFSRGYWYGTLKKNVTDALAAGKWIILEIDVAGAQKVLAQHPNAITIFLHPGSLPELEKRLRGRQTETESAIQRRLEVAKHELEYLSSYQYEVINHTVDQASAEICQILNNAEVK